MLSDTWDRDMILLCLVGKKLKKKKIQPSLAINKVYMKSVRPETRKVELVYDLQIFALILQQQLVRDVFQT